VARIPGARLRRCVRESMFLGGGGHGRTNAIPWRVRALNFVASWKTEPDATTTSSGGASSRCGTAKGRPAAVDLHYLTRWNGLGTRRRMARSGTRERRHAGEVAGTSLDGPVSSPTSTSRSEFSPFTVVVGDCVGKFEAAIDTKPLKQQACAAALFLSRGLPT